MRIFKTLLTVLALIGLFACSKANDKVSNFDPNTGKHLAGWVVALSGGNHPEAYLRDSNSCSECHGKNLAGGISKVSCFSASRNGINCHPGGPANHPAGWAGADSHGAAAKAIFTDRNGMIHCQRCHGADFAGGTSGKSCLNTAGCHGTGIMAAHPQKPWRSSIGGRTHSNTDASNAAACAACHANGANSARQPAPAAPPGTTPGCFNNTLCHGVEGHPSGWNAANRHGAAAKDAAGGNRGFSSCIKCHGAQFNGGTSGQSCLSTAGCHGAAVAAPHPARPWKSAGGPSHTSTDTSNASQCVPCHTNGANSTRAPQAGNPVGTGSCFNNTLCHGTIGHAAGWSAATLHGAEAKKGPTAATGFSSCQPCHGVAFNNGSAISCMNGSGCHGLQVSAPHPAKPWTSATAGAPTHTSTDSGNVGTCAVCHSGGANSDIIPPAPASGSAGCFNNTLCHFHSIPYADPAAHGVEAKKDLLVCRACHGAGFSGGTASTACSSCHSAAGAHPTDWQGSGTYSHRTAQNIANACSICHNVLNSGSGLLAGAPSCLSATFTNAAGQVRTCHAGGPGNAPHAVPYANHNAAARTNSPYCLSCHQIPQSGTVPPGCQNCHISSPVVTPVGCTSCHGDPPDGTTYPNVSDAHADHLTSTRVAILAVTCSDCHSGLGVGTVDHQLRAKARTATGRNNPVAFSNGALIAAGGGTAPTFNDVNGQCSSTYCHGAKMPGGDISGNNRSPIWSSPFLPANITVAACAACHGFPPSAASGHPAVSSPTSFPLGSGCGCHANINSAGTSYANIFINKALHINGIFEQAASGTPNHPGATPVTNPVYPGSLHRSVGTGYVAACGGCHDYATAGVYPSAAGTPPNCRGCHTASLGVGCSDCHGDTATGRPDGTPNSFPNRPGEHRISNHINRACTACHPFTSGDTRHGWSNRLKSSAAQVGGTGTSIRSWNTATKSCLPSCHGTETW